MKIKHATQEYLKNGYFYDGMVCDADRETVSKSDIWTLTRDVCRLSQGEFKIIGVEGKKEGGGLKLTLGIKPGFPAVTVRFSPEADRAFKLGNWHQELKKRGTTKTELASNNTTYLVKALAPSVDKIIQHSYAAIDAAFDHVYEQTRRGIESDRGWPWMHSIRQIDADAVQEILEVLKGNREILHITPRTRLAIDKEDATLQVIFKGRDEVMEEIRNYFGKEKLVLGLNQLGVMIGSVKYKMSEEKYDRTCKTVEFPLPLKLYEGLDHLRKANPDLYDEVMPALLFHKVSREGSGLKPVHMDKDGYIPYDGVYSDTHSVSANTSTMQPQYPQWFLMDRVVPG